MVRCPKCKGQDLIDGVLGDYFNVTFCPDCEGMWIPASEYAAWQKYQPQDDSVPEYLSPSVDLNYTPSIHDGAAAQCPECSRYLSRAKVNLKKPFFVEHCGKCGGYWCDRGEWDVLQYLGIHSSLQLLFSNEWQMKVQQKQQAQKERSALVDKLGSELADAVMELGEWLANHPHRDFAVAYLARRVSGK